MAMRRMILALLAAIVSIVVAEAQPKPPVVTFPRIYVFEGGSIKGLDPKLFNFKREELKEVDFVNVAYLVVHPKGTIMFDTGGIPDSAFKPGGGTVTEGIMSATKPLKPQLAAVGYKPSDIRYLILSHYHSDHTGNANAFAGATWIAQKADRDFMFADKPQGIIQPATYNALKGAKTRILDNEDLDVFGDGTVVIKSAPGHTPGHQVLFVKLAKTGGVVLSGDLYHYPQERTMNRYPTFEFNEEQTRGARTAVEEFLARTKSQLWIQHDILTNATLKKSPQYYD